MEEKIKERKKKNQKKWVQGSKSLDMTEESPIQFIMFQTYE